MPTREEAKKMDEARSAAADAQMRGDWDQAIAIHKQLIADLERLLGPDHLDTRAWQVNLQSLYSGQAMAIQEQLAKMDPARSAMAEARRRGDWDQAIAGYKQYIADLERLLGPNHPDTRAWQVNLQSLYSDQAMAIQKQLIADGERVLDPDHPDTLTARAKLQSLYWSTTKRPGPGLSVQEWEQLIADCERVLGPDHPATLTLRADLASWREALSAKEYSGPLAYSDPSWT